LRDGSSRNASDALPTIREQGPDLIILDIRMEKPDDGLTLLSTLRLAPETPNTPVIICSADGRFLAAKSAQLLAHGVETLEKPFNIKELLEKIRRMLKSEAQTP
jgi:CheY-like chemotaxis protein